MSAKATYIASKIAQFLAESAPLVTSYEQVMAFNINTYVSGITLEPGEASELTTELNTSQTTQTSTLLDCILGMKNRIFAGLNIPVTLTPGPVTVGISVGVPSPGSVDDDNTNFLKQALTDVTVVRAIPPPGSNSGGSVVYSPPTHIVIQTPGL